MPENNTAQPAAPAMPGVATPSSSKAGARRLWKKVRRWVKKRAFITCLIAPMVLAFFYFILLGGAIPLQLPGRFEREVSRMAAVSGMWSH